MTTSTPRVIKSTTGKSTEPTSFNLIDLRYRFEQYADEVKQQCRRWIEQAQGECDAIRKRAHDEGRASGYEAGMLAAAEEIDQSANALAAEKISIALSNVTPALQTAVDLLDEQRFQYLARWETAAVNMAIMMTEKLTGRMIERDATVVRDRAMMALLTAAGSGEGFLHMNPEDVAALGFEAQTMFAGSTYEIVADHNIKRGDCVLRRPEGEVDARLSTQIDRIVEELIGFDDDGDLENNEP